MIDEEPRKLGRPRWEELVALLSMDVVIPFFDLMGLQISMPSDLQGVFRRVILDARKNADAASDKTRSFPEETIAAVSLTLGVEASSRLVWWNDNVFLWDSTQDNVHLRKWTSIVRHCARDPGRWAQLGFPTWFSPDQFYQSRDLTDYQTLQDDVDAKPLSDWDLHLYSLRLYDDNVYEKSVDRVPDGPRLYVKPTVRAYRGYQFWNLALKAMNSSQRDDLWHQARRIAREEEILSDFRSLPHPTVLDILQ